MTLHVTQTAFSLNVPEPASSAAFLTTHFGYAETMNHEVMISLDHPSGGSQVVLLQTGLPSFTPAHRAGSAGDGLLIVLVVTGIDAAHQTLVGAGVPVVTEPTTEPWGERYSQYQDPNGLIVQLVEWV